MNAKTEFLRAIGERKVLCAQIRYEWDYGEESFTEYLLPAGYTPDQMLSFLQSLDFEYDNGYGGQELFGTIWYTDGTWSERGEYDGSEWWEYMSRPTVPASLLAAFLSEGSG
jgi:hypothetical protein